MDSQNSTHTMNQAIFNMDLSTETISVYLLCCSLVDAGSAITVKNLLGIWNSTNEALFEGLRDLEQSNILKVIISDGKENKAYRLKDAKSWRLSHDI